MYKMFAVRQIKFSTSRLSARFLAVFAFAVLFNATASSQEIKSPLETSPQIPVVQNASGSLFSDTTSSSTDLLIDFKPRRVGDLVFVDVVEQSTATVQSSARRNRDSGAIGGIGTIAGALPLPGAAIAGGLVGALGTRKFEGKGSTQRSSDVQARIVARVVEILPNGDFVIAARKQVRINKETEWLNLSGIVRARDVSADNSVPTTVVGDLQVDLNGKGVASADNAPGWLFRLFEKISPF